MPKHQPFHNGPPTEEPAFSPEDVRAEFARRLSAYLDERGWNQSELSRRASERLQDGEVSRDNISSYVRGKSLPGPRFLGAICRALGVKAEDLIPKRMTRQVDSRNAKVEFRAVGDGKAWLRVNQAVSWDTGTKILQLLQDEK